MTEWIRVNDRLPVEGIRVLTINRYNQYKIDYIVDLETEKIWACILNREQNKVTHWMPLPQTPKE